MLWRYVLLFLGVFGCSTSVVLIKASQTHPTLLVAARLLIAAALLSPLFWLEWRKHRSSLTSQHLRRTALPAVVLAVHFISWTYAARMTLAAQATLIVNLVPVAMPFFLYSIVGERINRTEIVGTFIAIAGVFLLTAGDELAGSGNTLGNLLGFGSMLLFAWYLAPGRKNRDFPSLWLYVIPVYLQAGAICLLFAVPWAGSFAIDSVREWSLLVGLAVVPTIVGHSLLNLSLRHLRGQVVSLCNTGQFVFAGAMAYFFFREEPAMLFYAASAVVVSGIAVVVFSAPAPPPRLR